MKEVNKLKKQAVKLAIEAKNTERIDKINFAQISYAMTCYVSTHFVEMFQHELSKSGNDLLKKELARLVKINEKMAKTTGLSGMDEEVQETIMDVQDFISEIVNKIVKALQNDKVGAMLDAVKYI